MRAGHGPGGTRRRGRARARAVTVDVMVHACYAVHNAHDDFPRRSARGRACAGRAAVRGVSVSAFIADTLTDALTRTRAAAPKPFRLVSVGGGGTRPGIDLDRPRALDVDDDERRFGRRER